MPVITARFIKFRHEASTARWLTQLRCAAAAGAAVSSSERLD
jgi:hypothetical protein